MINTEPAALQNCAVGLPSIPPGTVSLLAGLTMNYQTTDPATNALTGTPNTPVTIPGNGGIATFLLAFRDPDEVVGASVSLAFSCDGIPAPVAVANSIGLSFGSYGLSADLIALAATPTNNGIIAVPQGGAAAFSIASINLGSQQTLTV